MSTESIPSEPSSDSVSASTRPAAPAAPPPGPLPAPPSATRRAFAPYPWLSARARNAFRRRATISITAGVAFTATLLGLVLIPRQAQRSASRAVVRAPARPDTGPVLAARHSAQRLIDQVDSSLADARLATILPAEPPPVIDTFPVELRAERDSLQRVLALLDAAMARAASSPLPPMFRDLAGTPALRGEPNVQVWLDSLDTVDKLRAPFGALGAGDPIYVSLTARVNELGRSIRDAAQLKQSELKARIAPLLPTRPNPDAFRPRIDTMPLIMTRDSATQAYMDAIRTLTAMRARNDTINGQLAAARQLANLGAPPIAMLGAALVIALASGFLLAFLRELKHPRLAHAREAESVAGGRVLAVIRPSDVVERDRRQSDLDAPPLIDIVSESYRTLYLHLAATGASVPIVTVTGEQSAVVATIATNLAAVAAYEARSTLLVDADPATASVASVLRIPREPGVMGIVHGKTAWNEAVISTTIGRDRPLDVLPSGVGRLVGASADAVAQVRADLTRMERRYDFIVIVAPTSYAQLATHTIIPAQDIVLCARIGHTRLAELASAIRSLRGVGRKVHGVVLWDDDVPRLT